MKITMHEEEDDNNNDDGNHADGDSAQYEFRSKS